MTATPKTLTVTESHQLLDALLVKNGTEKQFRKGIRNYTMALLMLEAGLRVGEVIKLRSRQLYFNGLPVTSIIIPPEIAKNGKERTVPVSTRLCKTLNEHARLNGVSDNLFYDRFVFTAETNERPLTTRQVERILRAAGERSLGRPVHPHILRHTFASKLMRVTDMRTVQELLGHSNISTTQIYTHPNEDDKKKAIGTMSTGDIPADLPG